MTVPAGIAGGQTLRAHWRFDQVGGVAVDATGQGHDGALLGGPIWTTGVMGGALQFDGQNDGVRVDAAGFGMTTWTGITVSAWVKSDVGVGAGTDDIMSWWKYPSSRSWLLTHHNNNQYFFEISGKTFITGGTVSTGWTHIVGTYDGNSMRLYQDGVQVANAGGLSGSISSSSADILIAGQDDLANFFDGTVDDARIYDGALAAQGVQDLFDESLPAFSVTFDEIPMDLEVVARDLLSSTADVLIAGTETRGGFDSAVLRTFRDGAPTGLTQTQSLTYVAGSADFAFSPSIPAELAEYDFEISLQRAGSNYPVRTVSRILAGDIFVVQGQSNAEAREYNGSSSGYDSPFVRTFGLNSDTAIQTQQSLEWTIADGDGGQNALGGIGQWGLVLGHLIGVDHGVPVAILNGADSGKPVGFFQRNDADPNDLSTNYGRLLYRIQQAGVEDAIRAVVYYQGESDGDSDGSVHEAGVLALREDWKADFTALETIYLFQVREGCAVSAFDLDLRNRQRLLPDLHADLSVMSTSGVDGHDGCHYDFAGGYESLGHNLFGQISRDLYGGPAGNVDPPNPAMAELTAPAEIQITLRSATDSVTFDPGAEVDFQVSGAAVSVIGGAASNGIITLQLSDAAAGATEIHYKGHSGAGPWVVNASGVGMLAFSESIILPPDPTPPTAPQNLATTAVGFTTVDLKWDASSDPETGIDSYEVFRDGGKIGESTATNYSDSGLSTDTAYSYTVRAVNNQGLVSSNSAPLVVTTLSDVDPPAVLEIQATETRVEILFDQVLEAASATDIANYAIDGGIVVLAAALLPDGQTVVLTTSPHAEGPLYTCTITAVEDLFGNAISQTAVPYTPVFNDPDFRGHWKLNETSGATAADSSPSANDGLVVGTPVWTPGGKVSGALSLDGVVNRVVIDATSLAMDAWSEFTVSAWVKNARGPGAGTDDIASQWNYPSQRGWVLTHHNNNQYFFEINGKGHVSGGTVSANWTHVAATYDGSTMRLYQDGVEVAVQGGVSGNLPRAKADVVIGSQDDVSNLFAGLIDDVRLYSRALSASEIQGVYGNSLGVVAGADVSGGIAPLAVAFSAQDPAGNIVSYSWDFGDGEGSTLQNPSHDYVASGAYVAQVVATNDQGETSSDSVLITVSSGGPPTIDVWYGSHQAFGDLGTPQVWLNILGNVDSAADIASLTYSLNGGASRALSWGPDLRRLALQDDFNVELDIDDVLAGSNTVEIVVTNTLGQSASQVVDVGYDSSTLWPLPHNVVWEDVTNIQDVLQVVDGLWAQVPGGIRSQEISYDRVLAVGDMLWEDYEITVPITIHGFTPGYLGPESVSAGFGMTMRWFGHTDDPVWCPQLHCGWLPSGAGAWYNIGAGGPLLLDGLSDPLVSMNVGDTYIWKLRVETIPEVGPLYSLKVWEEGQSEPLDWHLQRQRDLSDVPSGSIVLNAHHVDVTFGDFVVVSTDEPDDTTPPSISFADAASDTAVTAVFSEQVDPSTATNTANYSIDGGITIFDAMLQPDGQTVDLTTSEHMDGLSYTLDVVNVEDLANPSNVMLPEAVPYTYTVYAAVAHYPLDDGGGSTADDISGNGNVGTLAGGATWVVDPQEGTVVDLDGSSGVVVVNPGPLAMDTWAEFSVTTWVKSDIGLGAGTDDIVSWWSWTGYPCSDCSWLLSQHNNNKYRFEIQGIEVMGGRASTAWTHVAATYDGSVLRLYVNGNLVDSTPRTGGIPFSSADLVIGGQGDGANYFDGRVSDVRIYDRALTPGQVLGIFMQ